MSVLGDRSRTAASAFWFRADFAAEAWTRAASRLRSRPRAAGQPHLFDQNRPTPRRCFHDRSDHRGTLHAIVAAVADYFPTLDPTATGKPFVVTQPTLSRARQRETRAERDVDQSRDSQSAVSDLLAAAHARPSTLWRIHGLQWRRAPFSAADNPLQAGIYGVVSLGFLIAGVLSLLGFFAYAYLSLQRRLPSSPSCGRWASRGRIALAAALRTVFPAGRGRPGRHRGGCADHGAVPALPAHRPEHLPPYLVVVPWSAVESLRGRCAPGLCPGAQRPRLHGLAGQPGPCTAARRSLEVTLVTYWACALQVPWSPV